MRSIVFAVVVVASGACSNTSGCNTEPLPAGGLPADQTIEGGAQIRVTKQGMAKLAAAVPTLLDGQFANGFCVPSGSQYTVDYCYETQGQCSPGCKVDVGVNSTRFSVTDAQTLTIALDVNAHATVPADAPFFDACHIFVDGNSLRGDADIVMGIDPTTGELTLTLAAVRNVDLSGLQFSGDGAFCSGASSFADFLKDYFAQAIVDYLTPTLNNLVQGFLPHPLGLEGLVDLSSLLAGVSPGSSGSIEARIVPGGFAKLDPNAQGVTLGVITGINSDEDPSTRTPDLDSEPSRCVPPMPAPVFGAPPHSLPITARNSYQLPAAGLDSPTSDLVIGLSETTLDLIGHHAVTSGLMCLGLGTATIPQLTVGTFGILVPSVAELGSPDGKDPILLVTRPQRAVDISIGDNTPASPALTLHLADFEIDIYPFLYERYTRAFTMAATVDVGINFDFDHPAGGGWRVTPMLVGLSSTNVHVTVENSQFLKEDKAALEHSLPSVFDLLAGQLAIPPIALPTFAGFAIDSPSIGRVTTAQDQFLALNASLQLGAPFTRPAHVVARAALRGVSGTTIVLDVDSQDRNRALEWSWRIGDGMWHPYVAAAPLAITDRAFLWQGDYAIGVRARAVGQPGTESDEAVIPVSVRTAPVVAGEPFHGQPGAAGCGCSTDRPDGLVVIVLTAGFLRRNRRRWSRPVREYRG